MGRVAFTKMGMEQGATWGTEVALGASDQIAPLGLEVSRANRAFHEDPSLLGSVWGNPGQVGAKAFEGTLRLRARYGHNCPKLMALALGEAETPGGGGPYTHALNAQNRLAKFLTLAWQAVVNASTTVYCSVPSCMVEEAMLSLRDGEPGVLSLGLVGNKLERDAGTNGSTQFGNLTLPDSDAFILPTDGVLRLNAQGGTTLGSGDALKFTAVDIRVRRVLSRDFKVEGSGALAQPVDSEVGEITLTVEGPGLGAASSFASAPDEWMDRFEAETELKADLTLTKDSNNIWKFEFPRLQVVEMPPMSLPESGRYPLRVVMRGLVAASAPTGMAGVTQPMKLTVTDQLSGAFLT